MDSIFEMYNRGNQSQSNKFEGTGLGLAITKKMVDSLGGEIEVQSILGEGSEFEIKLPISLEMKDAESV